MSMGTIRRVDSTGDTILAEWDTKDKESVDHARHVFDVEARNGLMSRCDEGTDLSGVQLREFDPEAGEILAVGMYAGG